MPGPACRKALRRRLSALDEVSRKIREDLRATMDGNHGNGNRHEVTL